MKESWNSSTSYERYSYHVVWHDIIRIKDNERIYQPIQLLGNEVWIWIFKIVVDIINTVFQKFSIKSIFVRTNIAQIEIFQENSSRRWKRCAPRNRFVVTIFLHSVKNVTIAELFSADRATGFYLLKLKQTIGQKTLCRKLADIYAFSRAVFFFFFFVNRSNKFARISIR